MVGGGTAGAAAATFGVDEFAVGAVLDARVQDCGRRTMMCIGGVDVSFAQMRDRSVRAANVLVGLGLRPGDTLALFGGSSPEWVYFWLGAARVGVICAAVNAANRGESLRHALTVCRARVVIVDTGERRDRVREVSDGLRATPTVVGIEPFTDAPEGAPPSLTVLLDRESTAKPDATLAHRPDAPAALFFTSGTTGPSKAVATTWQYLFTAAATVARSWDFGPGEVIWSAMPLFHLSAVATILAPMLVGGTTVLATEFHPTEVWDDVRACGAVGFVGAGAMVSMLLNLPPNPDGDVAGLRFLSAAPIAADLYRPIEQRYGCRVVTMYGLTEAFPIAVKAVDEVGVPGTSGRVHSNFEVTILGPHGPEGIDRAGEIVCRAAVPGAMSLGYVDDSVDGLHVTPHDDWFRTGDLGRLDAAGNLTYVDRVKDAIRRRGENVSSVEVETVVSGYPGVAEAAAVGVPSLLGEQDILVVLGACDDADLDPVALLDFCAERLPYFCVPRYVRVVPALPRNVVGRVRKDLLRAAGVGSDGWDREAHGYELRR